MAFSVQVVINGWDNKIELMVVPLNDFDMIPSNDFFVAAKVAVLPHLFGLLIGNEEKLALLQGIASLVILMFANLRWRWFPLCNWSMARRRAK